MLAIFRKKNRTKNRLIVFDDIFPFNLSAFRLIEFNYYLDEKDLETIIYTSGVSLKWIDEKKSIKKVINEYVEKNPDKKKKVKKFSRWKKFNGKLLYTVFLNNIFCILKKVEKDKIPFIFTLYPGGGFFINNEQSEEKLKRVFASPFFRKVIVTQINVYQYLIDKNYCDKEKIEFIYGGLFLSSNTLNNKATKKLYPQDKKTFDICFMAHKYMPRGKDKGYDIFIEVAKKLSGISDIRFYVIGGYDGNDANIDSLRERINFHGVMSENEFPQFFSTIDIILSPNRPFIFTKGSFDGFPTACCVNAGSNGVAVFCSDELNLNIKLRDGEDICIIPINSEKIASLVVEYYKNPKKLYELSLSGKNKFLDLFSTYDQMAKRMMVIRKYLK